MSGSAVATLGVVGAGTMGAGIAELGCLAGLATRLYDASADAREAARKRISRGELQVVDDMRGLEGCELIVEAVPEDLELKRAVLAALPDDAVLATNTSSLSVSEIARGCRDPERVVGMHFFNPPTRMRLVEIVQGVDTDERALALASAVATALGRTPILARDTVGFVANRCARPFYAEALQLLEEGVASPEVIDRVCRTGAGFRMGPFELMDLVGIDVGLAVARTFTERSFGEPRWRPSALQAQLVDAGRLGRKTGQGFFDYRSGPPRRDDEPPLPGQGGNGRTLVVLGSGDEADGLRRRAAAHGFELEGDAPLLTVDFSDGGPAEGPLAVSCAASSLATAGRAGAVGFHILPPVEDARVIELTRLPATSAEAVAAAEELAHALGLPATWVDDAPGLVLGRIVCQLVNEACFALGSRIATRDAIDLAMRTGLNHPFGPLEWGERIGWANVLRRIDGLWEERHDPRYRAAPLLRRAVAA